LIQAPVARFTGRSATGDATRRLFYAIHRRQAPLEEKLLKCHSK